MRNHYFASIAEGVSAETRFTADYLLCYPDRFKLFRRATRHEDMREHWDVSINDVKIDVKARRRLNRNSDYCNDFAIFEIKNTYGTTGWGYGQADYIAYEFETDWVVVSRPILASYIETKLAQDDKVYDKFKGPYLKQSRRGQEDLFTWMPTEELRTISHYTLKKIITEDAI